MCYPDGVKRRIETRVSVPADSGGRIYKQEETHGGGQLLKARAV
jgi:hypothetical protein